ncbi:bloodthirsty-related gene family, member 2 isoform X2 [Clupea harengus]|uniref:Bloodthirsty-related gene family, member 2 isoform X2 n=1 Tax=Clupea harengus TaxID=7950 RepID=A0A8M1KC44_CLUHA|nr:bloodthirsty-related gene family, member 2 isoform X2 [Clupea harengus]
MASTIGLLAEKHFLCSLCEHIFTNPVTTPCGHSFCKVCLRQYCTQAGVERCPSCKKVFGLRHRLSVNRILADVTENYRVTRQAAKQEGRHSNQKTEKTAEELEQMIQKRLLKVDQLKNSLKLLKSSCQREVKESHRVFTELVTSIEQSHTLVVAAVEEKERQAEKRVSRLVRELEREIRELRQGDANQEDQQTEMKRWSSRITLEATELRDWSRVSVETDPCVGVTRRAVLDLVDRVLMEANRLSKSELKRLQKYSVDVTLNPQTAHAYLILSEDKKQVRHGDKRQDVLESPRRFDRVANVLAKESFLSGRHYWEVDVGSKTEWDMGVVRHSVNRKGKFTVCPANGFWTVSLRNGNQYIANTSPPTPLALRQRPKRIAVYVDYEEGRTSFLCVDSGAHIHTFMDAFTDRLHPFFGPGRPHGGKNTAFLTVTSSCCSI